MTPATELVWMPSPKCKLPRTRHVATHIARVSGAGVLPGPYTMWICGCRMLHLPATKEK